MKNGTFNGTLKILTINMSGGILPLTDETLQLSELKHPDTKDTDVTDVTTSTNTKNASNCVWWHRRRATKKSSNKSKRRFGTIRTRCRWAAKDYSFMFWSSNIRSPQSNCRTHQEVMYHKYIKQRLCIFEKLSCMQVDTASQKSWFGADWSWRGIKVNIRESCNDDQ